MPQAAPQGGRAGGAEPIKISAAARSAARRFLWRGKG